MSVGLTWGRSARVRQHRDHLTDDREIVRTVLRCLVGVGVAHSAKQGFVLAAYSKPCMWDVTAIGSLYVLPSNGIPVRLWTNPEAAWTEVARAVRACVQEQAPGQRTQATLGVPPSPEAFYGRSADRTALKERLAAAVRSSGELPKAHVLTTLGYGLPTWACCPRSPSASSWTVASCVRATRPWETPRVKRPPTTKSCGCLRDLPRRTGVVRGRHPW